MAATGTREHWDAAYTTRGTAGVSWYQDVPDVSLALIEELGVSPDSAVIDVGSGGSHLARELLQRGFTDLTVLDTSSVALDAT